MAKHDEDICEVCGLSLDDESLAAQCTCDDEPDEEEYTLSSRPVFDPFDFYCDGETFPDEDRPY